MSFLPKVPDIEATIEGFREELAPIRELPAVREELAAIRGLLEQLLEIEQRRD